MVDTEHRSGFGHAAVSAQAIPVLSTLAIEGVTVTVNYEVEKKQRIMFVLAVKKERNGMSERTYS